MTATSSRDAVLRALQHDRTHREGVLLALADLMAIVGDKCCAEDNWLPEVATTWGSQSAGVAVG